MTSGGNGQLQYPIALITADEISFIGGEIGTGSDAWYGKNSQGSDIVDGSSWWTMSPAYYSTSSSIGNLCVIGMDGFAGMSTAFTNENGKYSLKVRPVLSLKSCVKYSSGNGTPTNPYTVTIDDDCANKEN